MPTTKAPGMLAPERLTAHHDLTQFKNGKHDSLDVWFRSRDVRYLLRRRA